MLTFSLSVSFLLLTLQALSMPLQRRDDSEIYEIPGVGTFNTLLSVDFRETNALPDDMRIDTYTVAAGYQPYARQFMTENIVFNGDSMSMFVPGGQDSTPISSAQISTVYNDVLYGSVRTVAKASTSAGTVHG